ncbi:hypothetical protein IWW45_007132, partial [Coemansia sp. RSA 485]
MLGFGRQYRGCGNKESSNTWNQSDASTANCCNIARLCWSLPAPLPNCHHLQHPVHNNGLASKEFVAEETHGQAGESSK